MNARLTIFSLMTVAIAAVSTALIVKRIETPATSSPRAVFPKTIDLGSRQFGEIVTSVFRLRNDGGSQLEASRFRTSCSCAGVEAQRDGVWYQVDKVRIAPGEDIDLTIRYLFSAPSKLAQLNPFRAVSIRAWTHPRAPVAGNSPSELPHSRPKTPN